MPTLGHTEQTEQRVLNDSKDAVYDALDTIPYVETTPGSVAGRVSGGVRGSKTALTVEVVDASGNQITSFGSVASLPSSVVTGQVKVAVTGTAVQFPSNALTNGVIINANGSNAAVVTLGGASVTNTADGTGNGVVVLAGAAVSAAVSNTNALYVNGTAGDWVSFIGS